MNNLQAQKAANILATYGQEDKGSIFLKSQEDGDISKGRKAEPLGTKKNYGGVEYMKTATGWKPVGKHSGAAKEAHDFVHGKPEEKPRYIANVGGIHGDKEIYMHSDKKVMEEKHKDFTKEDHVYAAKKHTDIHNDLMGRYDDSRKEATGHLKEEAEKHKIASEWHSNKMGVEKKFHDMGNGIKIPIQTPEEAAKDPNNKKSIRGAFDMANIDTHKKLASELGLSKESANKSFDELPESDRKKVYDHFAKLGHHDSDKEREKRTAIVKDSKLFNEINPLAVGDSYGDEKEVFDIVSKKGGEITVKDGKGNLTRISKGEGLGAYQTLQAMRIASCYGNLEKSINYKEATEKMNKERDPENIEKSEGSRGGKVIGHTKSGKPIYDTFEHEGHGNFTKEDHSDATKAHVKKMHSMYDKRYGSGEKQHASGGGILLGTDGNTAADHEHHEDQAFKHSDAKKKFAKKD